MSTTSDTEIDGTKANGDVSRRTVLKGLGGVAAVAGASATGLVAAAGPAAAQTATSMTKRDPNAVTLPLTKQRNHKLDRQVAALVKRMTVTEKLGQVQQLTLSATTGTGDPQDTLAGQLAAQGKLGSVFGTGIRVTDFNALQKIAVESSRLGIPLLIGADIIHGHQTQFPIPLAQASSFDPAVAGIDARISAVEASSNGIRWTFSPMMDVTHEPRWGRMAEGNGEDPYLTSAFAVAKVQGYQGENLRSPTSMAACAKHLIAYGQPEGGRDYNTVDLSEQRLRNLYMPPFRAAIQAGVATVMAAFNTVSGVPAHANHHVLTDVLRDEWDFEGFVVSDYTGVQELIAHGVAAGGEEAALLALNAGIDMEMVSTNIATHGEELLAAGGVKMARLDDAVSRILRLKFQLGLFDDPYTDPAKFVSSPTSEARAAARSTAARSMVLLKNDRAALPLKPTAASVAVIGPLADSTSLSGAWAGIGSYRFPGSTVVEGIGAVLGPDRVTFTPGTTVDGTDTSGFAAAVADARAAEAVVLVVGEDSDRSGEARSRSDITLPGVQEQLLAAVAATGKPLVVVVLNGRALDLTAVTSYAAAVLEAWHPGLEAGNAIADVLFGAVNPGGKLPVTFPRNVGQIPWYYNHESTGRPNDPNNRFTTGYTDLLDGPLFPFGHGLSYTTFEFTGLRATTASMSWRDLQAGRTVEVSVDVRNTGSVAGDEVVQIYVHDPVAMIAQPVRKLRGFRRVTLAASQKETVVFNIGAEDLGYWTNNYDGEFILEPGAFEIYVGNSSAADAKLTLQVVR